MNRHLPYLLVACCLTVFGTVFAAAQAVSTKEPRPAPFINSWLVCGPFKHAVAAGTSIPKVGETLDGKPWEYLDDRLWNRNYDNYQDLSGYYAVRKGVDTRNQYVYAATSVFSPTEQTVEFRFGISGTGRLFVNGTERQRIDTPKEVQRDMYQQGIPLQQGWNRILLEIRHDYTADKNANGAEIAKDAAVSYLGCYGRVTDAAGNDVPGILYSTRGDAAALTIDTQALAAADVVADPSAKGRGLPANALPTGYLEWPYVWNKSLYPVDNRRIWADAYRFQAGGGSPGYRWGIVAGSLPDGLTLSPDGAIGGFCTKAGEFHFTVQVTDSKSLSTRKELAITVKDRPTRWFEEGRVGALSHCPAVYPFWVDLNFSADLWAERAKRQGHSLVSIESLQQNYYWPSRFEDPKHPRNLYQPRNSDGKVLDGLKPFADAVRRHGMKFGLYYATEGGGLGHHSTDVFVQNCSDLIRRYDPAYLYFDGPQAMKSANYDVMYSNVRNYGDEIIINSNVSHGWGGEYGDADLGTTEASHIYANANPARFTKRIVVEPWKSIHTKNNPTPYYAKRDDFRQVAKEMIMNTGRGYVDNNDQMPLMSRGPNWDPPADIARRYPMAVQEFSDVREGTAGWFSPRGKPERHESTTGTVPYFLSGCGYENDGKGNIAAFAKGQGPAWGYATARGQNIYLHFIKGPDGKKGYCGEKSITIAPVTHRVQKVLWLNEDKPLPFKQNGQTLTLHLDGLAADPVDTIVKIITDNPTRKYQLTNLVATGRQLTSASIQVEIEGYMTYPALKVPFAKGAVRFQSSDPAVAKVDATGAVTAVAPGKAFIIAEGISEGTRAKDSLAVVVDAAKNLRVDDKLIGVVLKVNGKEAYTRCAGTAALPFTLEGRSQKGGPISLHTAKITMKTGLVDYTKGTPFQPVFITTHPIGSFKENTLVPLQAKEPTRAAVWAEVELDGVKTTTNKVFLDMEPAVTRTTPATVITSSGHLGEFTPDKVNDGIGIARDGLDRSKWSADGNAPSWLAFDLLETLKVSEVEILFNTLDQAYLNTPESMEIQASTDGRKWTTLATVTPPQPGSGAYFGFTDTFRFMPVSARHLRLSFPKGNPKGDRVDLLEVIIKAGLVNNLAARAKVTASSAFLDRYGCENAIDGIVGENARGEWASKGEANPWIRLEWPSKTTLNKIVLRDRPNPGDHLKQGTLTFSDGSRIEVSEIPNDGSPKTIPFPAKTVQWVRFQATGNGPGNNGLSEFEAYGLE